MLRSAALQKRAIEIEQWTKDEMARNLEASLHNGLAEELPWQDDDDPLSYVNKESIFEMYGRSPEAQARIREQFTREWEAVWPGSIEAARVYRCAQVPLHDVLSPETDFFLLTLSIGSERKAGRSADNSKP